MTIPENAQGQVILRRGKMPFKSEAQRRYLYLHHPRIAARWSREYPDQGKLPEYSTEERRKENLKKHLKRRPK